MRQDAQYNHQKILTTATHLLSTQDIATMKMTDIAHAAGIGVGTLYRNYPNKSALCLALVYDRLRVFITTTQAQIEQTPFVMPIRHCSTPLVRCHKPVKIFTKAPYSNNSQIFSKSC
ncbi:TetR/AcrR family transcriptional regulator [Levilactobacillus brevis]|nr:TetR/AcrR family transcriptional regulator [Levilactobacillus brevis]